MPEWMREWLPRWVETVVAWLLQPAVLAMLTAGSLLFFVLSLIGLPAVLARLPSDFFSRAERRRVGLAEHRWPFWYVALRVVKNAVGAILFLLGLVMLFTPGPGLATMFVSLFLLDFPGKRRLQRSILSRSAVRRRINALRRRAGRPPLELPVYR